MLASGIVSVNQHSLMLSEMSSNPASAEEPKDSFRQPMDATTKKQGMLIDPDEDSSETRSIRPKRAAARRVKSYVSLAAVGNVNR